MTDQPAKPRPAPSGPYRRVLLKISGEALMGDQAYGIDMGTAERIAEEVGAAVAAGYELCLVIGGGNIFRGLSAAAKGMDRAAADYMGMLATVMNALAMQTALERRGVQTRVQSAIPMTTVCEPYIRRRAVRHMEKGRVVIFAAGTGNPFFTTDTSAALRARELECDVLLKATKVDGVYTADPKKDPTATRYDHLGFTEAINKRLGVMDTTALAMCQEHKVPVLVFDFKTRGNIRRVIAGENIGTLVDNRH